MTCDTCDCSSYSDEHIENGRYGLHDGTPGCWGVLVEGVDDPRFDIENDEFEPFGFIYLLTNTINGKQYVGQTTKTVEERWKGHVKEAHNYISSNGTRKKTHASDAAIAKYGEENFIVETIECCLVSVLDEREIYWIQEHDCCLLDGKEKGYNISRGGKGFLQYLLDEKEIAKLYHTGISANELASMFKVSSSTIRCVLVKNGYELRDQEEIWDAQRRSYDQTVNMLDDDGNIVKTFDSQGHAGDWIVEQGLTKSTSKGARTAIKDAFLKQHKAYGYWWIIDGIDDDELIKQRQKIKTSSRKHQVKLVHFNKAIKWSQNRINNATLDYKPKTFKPKKRSTPKLCSYDGCDKPTIRHSKYCEEHFCPPHENHKPDDLTEVIILVCETSFREAGKFYGVSDNAIKNWFKRAGVPSKIKELKEYAIKYGLIDDPVENLPHEEIYKRFLEHGGIQSTAKAFHCTNDLVVKCCLKHGMTEEDIRKRNQESNKRNKQRLIAQCDEDGNVIQIFDSICQASRDTGIARIHITEECKGHRSTKWHWKFLN